MKQIVLNIKESKYSFFMELIKSLDFVQVQDSSVKTSNEDIKASLTQSIKEIKLIKEGKLKGIPAKKLLDEL